MSVWWEVKKMSKLLSAEFVRLWKSAVFKMGLLFAAGMGAFMVLLRWQDVRENPELYAQLGIEYSNADGLLFVGGLYLIFAYAVFVGIFVGTEYSDGTIRNKLTAGHTRSNIYLSKLLVCGAAGIMMQLVHILVVLALGNLLLNGTTMKAADILRYTAVSTTAMLALMALLLLFSMSIQNKAAGAVVCLLSVTIMLFAALTIWQRLESPEYFDAYDYVDQNTGKVVSVEREKNPRYLTGIKRDVYEFFNNFLPVSQIYQIVMNVSDNLSLIAVYDGVLILVTTGAGIVIFKKKDLR